MNFKDIVNKIFTLTNLKVLAVALLVVIAQAYPQFASISVFFSGLLGVNVVYTASVAGAKEGVVSASKAG